MGGEGNPGVSEIFNADGQRGKGHMKPQDEEEESDETVFSQRSLAMRCGGFCIILNRIFLPSLN